MKNQKTTQILIKNTPDIRRIVARATPKWRTLILASVLAFMQVISQAGEKPVHTDKRLKFTENKGQVTDQNFASRKDVLFSGHTNGLAYFLRDNGISYQLMKRTAQDISIYRVDVTWANCNSDAVIVAEQPDPDADHYYTGEIPVFNVKTYGGIMYRNVYKGIDLHYFQKTGELKCDYLVAAGADYREIRLQVAGAVAVTIGDDGRVTYTTPFGNIIEDAPRVFQQNREIASHWVKKGNELRFEIPDYDPLLPMIIDPATRVWGTYYGGGPGGFIGSVGNGCTSDMSGNVYLTGSTDGPANIATTGAHQTTVQGFLSAFLVKFNGAGVRQWGTYYGGTGGSVSTLGGVCRADGSGNVFLAGQSSANNSIATPGSHQPLKSSSADGYIVKFNSAGLRQWGTYFGGSGADEVTSLAIDGSGNVYAGGRTASAGGISTPGSHQSIAGGSDDGFLAKFNGNGVLQWCTYYGGTGTDRVYGCASDGSGNVFICGESASTSDIASPGSHQTSNGGGTNDAFVAKFNSSGVRQWGTYYGGSGNDQAYTCAVDASGNVLMIGTTSSGSGIATALAYQASYGGGISDAFLTKFNGTGTQLWGTYYGGNAEDKGGGGTVDATGNVLVNGQTVSASGIATAGSHQTTYGGGLFDGMMFKFDGSGTLVWGTYYGGAGRDDASDCTIDNNGKIYLAGSTNSSGGTVIATSDGHQSQYAGPNDSFLAQFTDCTGPVAPANSTFPQNLSVCSGNSATVSATASGAISWYAGITATAVIGTGSTLVTPTLSAGTYTYYAQTSNTCSPSARTPVTVTVGPMMSVNSGLICEGGSFTIVPGGALTYSYSGGSNVVAPTITTQYTVSGTDAAGCTGTVIATVTVEAPPVLTVNSGSVCSGNSFTISPAGAANYTFSGGSAVVTPTANSSYTVTGTSSNGCVNNSGVVSNVTVTPSPTVMAATSRSAICRGEQVGLSVSGAGSYSWSTGSTATLLTVTPSVTTIYSVTGTAENNCAATAVVTQSVKLCAGLESNALSRSITVFPNPAHDHFTIVLDHAGESAALEIYNSSGQLVTNLIYHMSGTEISVSGLARGLYYIKAANHNFAAGGIRIVIE